MINDININSNLNGWEKTTESFQKKIKKSTSVFVRGEKEKESKENKEGREREKESKENRDGREREKENQVYFVSVSPSNINNINKRMEKETSSTNNESKWILLFL